MLWIICIIFITVLIFFIRFIRAFYEQRRFIKSQGGIVVIYETLIDDLLKYQSARITENSKDNIIIGGTFTDSISKRECGLWSVMIQPTFKLLHIEYKAYNNQKGGMNTKKEWNFPINMSQEDMLTIIKKKADEWEVYGIFK